MLSLVFALALLDRHIIATLVEPIKSEFRLSDGQVGFLTGVAFAISYALCGVPVARLADRVSRTRLIAAILSFWSAMTALGGVASQYWHLVFARFGVGAGEAGVVPAAHSLISDLFAPHDRATAISFFTFGGIVGGSFAYYAGGWMVDTFGWRTTLFVAAAPGFVLSLVMLLLPEPRRGTSAENGKPLTTRQSFFRDVGELLSSPRYIRTVMAFGLYGLFSFGVSYWAPSFFIRSMEFTSTEAGRFLGISSLAGGILGTAFLATLGHRLLRADRRYYLWLPSAMTALLIAFLSVVLLAPSEQTVYLWFCADFFSFAAVPPIYAYVISLAPPERRALAASVNIVFLSVFGLGLGPQTVGWVSDLLNPGFGDRSLGLAIAFVCLAAVPCVLLLLSNVRREAPSAA